MTFILISDLDGTLLGHHDFDFDLIKSDIINLLDSGHLLVLASSKTKVEIKGFCDALGRNVPFIYENGAGVENFCLINGCEAPLNSHQNPKAIRTDALLSVWERYIPLGLKSRCHFIKDMDRGDQQALLGLGATALDRAMKRSFSLPFTFSGPVSDVQKLKYLAKKAGLSVQQGGRVYNLSGCHDKADYLPEIRKWASKAKDTPVLIVLGDSKNDIEMLKQADVSCVIPNENGDYLSIGNGNYPTIIAPRAAPLGWLDAVMEALSLFPVKEGVNYG
ncbi:MAG: hypothetical protein CMN48_05175 [SAR116 cluster bacterium]|nr:hypothetical protein [SAR116 cluster bacterium]RPG91642.1 MAG: hypothetical protein CBD73_005105 [Candidatus Puniceispirillum sp. TMED213]|tara:strand:+ start:1128 stop:1955 length:828 start_codon:yes stop_codon:yes gene_type:complete